LGIWWLWVIINPVSHVVCSTHDLRPPPCWDQGFESTQHLGVCIFLYYPVITRNMQWCDISSNQSNHLSRVITSHGSEWAQAREPSLCKERILSNINIYHMGIGYLNTRTTGVLAGI
jgi:hypothetical protein